MKTFYKCFLTVFIFCVTNQSFAQTNIFPPTGAAGIGTTTPDASSLLEIKSTSKGILIPRMTKNQRDLITTPAIGLLIYQTNSLPGFYYYNGSVWTAISANGANTALSNLAAPTAVNVDLLAGTDNTINLGSASNSWKDVYLDGSVYLGGKRFLSYIAGTGTGNTVVGAAVLNSNTTGISNTGVGFNALFSNITGKYNTANGYQALQFNSIGGNNTATGYKALQNNTTGSGNVANGLYALINNTTGYSNVAIGERALASNTAGHNLVAVGDSALFHQGVNSFDTYFNTAIGSKTLYRNTTGFGNTANGFNALYSNTMGADNTANGSNALYSNTIGYFNTANGEDALYHNTTASYNTANGLGALYSNTSGQNNTATGYQALNQNIESNNNTATGFRALYSNATGNNNTANGDGALYALSYGDDNTAIGYQAMNQSSFGYGNTAIGKQALYSSGGDNNTAIGLGALYSNTGGYGNTAIGYQALNNNAGCGDFVPLWGEENTSVGDKAGFKNICGNNNCFFGSSAGYSNTYGDNNTYLGYHAGNTVTEGNSNTIIGYGADLAAGSYSNSTALGNLTVCNASDQVRIGNSSVTSIGGYKAWTNLSDGRFKKDIKQDVPGLAFIKKLQPITYTLDVKGINTQLRQGLAATGKDGKKIEYPADDAQAIARQERTICTGFIAQDVEKAAKSLNYDFDGVDAPKNDKDFYGLRYAEFVVPLVKAVQELSAANDNKQQQIDSLKQNNTALLSDNKILHQQLNDINAKINQIENAMGQCCNSFSSNMQPVAGSKSSAKNFDAAKLEQNVPNPFNNSSYIAYYIPSASHNVQLLITDITGHVLKTYSIAQSGYGKQTIYGNQLISGMYEYSLLIDGKLIDTKKMILAK